MQICLVPVHPLLSSMAILYLVNDWLYKSQTEFLFLTVQTKACKVNNQVHRFSNTWSIINGRPRQAAIRVVVVERLHRNFQGVKNFRYRITPFLGGGVTLTPNLTLNLGSFLFLKKSSFCSQSGVKITPKWVIFFLKWVVFTLFGVNLTLKVE